MSSEDAAKAAGPVVETPPPSDVAPVAPAPQSLAALRTTANEFFTKGQLVEAAAAYEQVVAIHESGAPTVESSTAERVTEVVKCLGNLCTVYNKQGRTEDVLRVAAATLKLQPAHPKALAFFGQSSLTAAVAKLRESTAASASDEADDAVLQVMQAYRAVAAATLISPSLLGPQLQDSHQQYVAALRSYAQHCDAKAPKEIEIGEVRGGPSVIAGAGIVANSNVPMHATVAYLDRPVCVGYYSDNLGKGLCVSCGATEEPGGAARFIGCTACGAVAFCGDACMSQYGPRHDQFECAHFRNLKQMVVHIEQHDRDGPSDLVELASACITALSAVRTSHPDAYLIHALDNHSDEVAHVLGPTIPLIVNLLAYEDPRNVQRVCGAVRCNAIQISDASGLGLGQAVFGGYASRFNHSCLPNAAIDYENRCIRSIKPIRAGQEITISYVPILYQPTIMRQSTLCERYFFACRCPRCRAADLVEPLLTAVHATARSDADGYYRSTVLTAAETSRNLAVDEVGQGNLDEVAEMLAEVEKHCLPTHYLVQELRNAVTFLASVLGAKQAVAQRCEQEWLLWEAVVPGAVPVKLDKLRNYLLATTPAAAESAEVTQTRRLRDELATQYAGNSATAAPLLE